MSVRWFRSVDDPGIHRGTGPARRSPAARPAVLLRPTRAQHGVVLLEVLAALALVGIVVAALLQAVGSGLRSAAVSTEYSEAALTADSLLALAGAERPLVEGVVTGETELSHRWRLEVRPWALLPGEMVGSAPGGMEIHHLTLHLHWDGARGENTLVLDTLRTQVRR